MPRYIEVFAAASETAQKILALRAGKTYRVEVTTEGGRTASVNWSATETLVTLNMPTLPPDAMLTRVEADRLIAFIAHECCHVLHTDRGAWSRAVADGTRVKDWTNALEDVRIEHREITAGAFPALRTVLASMTNHLHYESVTEGAKAGRIIGANVSDAPYVACILGRVANGYAIPAAGGLRDGLSPEVTKLIAHALDILPRCGTTENVRRLAQQLVAMEIAASAPAEPAEGDKGSEGSQDGQEGTEGSEGSQDGQEGTEDSEGSQDGQDGAGSGPPTDADLGKTIDAIRQRNGCKPERISGRKVSHLSAVQNRIDRAPANNAPDNAIAANALNARLPGNSVLHGQIARLLVSEERRTQSHRETNGRLDRRALARMRTGAQDVFARRTETPGIDTALLILVDGSMSMADYNRMDTAQVAAWHIAKAAEAANGKVMVASFHNVTGHYNREDHMNALIRIAKHWDQPVSEAAGAIARIDSNSSTPLSAAIIECSRILADMNATRRILMVITDGECNYGPDGVRAACALAADLDVETVGVGINCDSVVKAFPPRYSVNVKTLAQLASTGLGVLVAMLEDANPQAAD